MTTGSEDARAREVRAAFRVTGMVQGVGFRYWTRRAGTDLGLRGAVMNLRDGAVEVHVVGAAHAIARLEVRLTEGPPGARVDRVERLQSSSLPIPESGFAVAR